MALSVNLLNKFTDTDSNAFRPQAAISSAKRHNLEADMKILATLFFALCFAASGFAADGDELYRQAEEREWRESNNMKDVDALYEKASQAGSEKAFMMRGYTRLAMADDGKELAGEICPKMAKLADKWAKSDKPDADGLFHAARFFSLRWCREHDIGKTRALLEKSAELGNPKASYLMGRALSHKDGKAAYNWLKKAADAGLPQAMANQGVCCLLGLGVPKDKKKGMELIDKAYASGNPNTLYDIAIWYMQGNAGLPKDPGKAEEILQKLAAENYEPALAPLADLRKAKKK